MLSNRERSHRYRDKTYHNAIVGLGGCCAACGEDDPFYLQIDHIEGVKGQKERRKEGVAAVAVKLSGYDRSRFQVICVRCHTVRTRFKQWEGRTAGDPTLDFVWEDQTE